MKKINVAIITAIVSIFLVGCNNSNVSDNGKNNNNDSSNSINDSVVNDNNSNNSIDNADINNNSSVNNGTNNKITIEQAKEIALQHAGLTSDQVLFLRSEYDIDDGVGKYDIEFNYNGREYSYEISTNNGDILSYEQD